MYFVASAADAAATGTGQPPAPSGHAAAVAGRWAMGLALFVLLIGLPILFWAVRVIRWWLNRTSRGAFPTPQFGRSLVVGTDQRASTSKTTAFVWTYSVAAALLSFLIARWLGHPGAYSHLLSKGLDAQYALLIGGPIGAAILAKGIVAAQVANGTTAKPAADSANPGQLVQDDSGNTSLGDTQYVLFNVIALAFFYGELFRVPQNGMPRIPDVLLGLTSVAAVGYVGNKTLNGPPAISSVAPLTASVGDTVQILTAGIAESGDDLKLISIAFGGASPVHPKSPLTPTTTQGVLLDVVVPGDAAGIVDLGVSVPNGRSAKWPGFRVRPAIVSDRSNPSGRVGHEISIFATGVAGLRSTPAQVSVTIGGSAAGVRFDTADQTGNTLEVTIPPQVLPQGVTQRAADLVVSTPGGPSNPFPIKVLS